MLWQQGLRQVVPLRKLRTDASSLAPSSLMERHKFELAARGDELRLPLFAVEAQETVAVRASFGNNLELAMKSNISIVCAMPKISRRRE
jgi:hypothetical protein